MKIGLIAHNSRKKLMQDFCVAYRGILSRHELYATGTTGVLIEDAAGLTLHKFLAGHLGGVEQMNSQIENNEMDLLIFLWDPTTAKSHEPSINHITRSCDIYNIPYATNLATAELLIMALDRGDLDWREAYR